jgi:hypothetical protein
VWKIYEYAGYFIHIKGDRTQIYVCARKMRDIGSFGSVRGGSWV